MCADHAAVAGRRYAVVMNDTEATVVQFNALINAGDVDGLAALMTEDHSFVDTGEHAVQGLAACREAWVGFFEAFPTYRNEFASVKERNGLVVMTGRSVCTDHVDLDGPAIWTARVVGGLVSEWRVYEDTPQVRRQLGVPGSDEIRDSRSR